MAFEIVRTVYTDSSHKFYIPPTSKSDFIKQTHTQIDHFTGTYTVQKDWYDQFDTDYEQIQVRATYYPIDWKSKIGNSDMSDNWKTGYEGIQMVKGDIVVNEEGMPLMLNWKVSNHLNNQASQAILMNEYLTFERQIPETVDKYGFVEEEAHLEVIADRMPVNITPYAGRPDYTTATNSPGILADSLYNCQVQLNRNTKNIWINDEFDYGGFRYRVINVDWSETDIEQQHGVLNLNMKRVAGDMAHEKMSN